MGRTLAVFVAYAAVLLGGGVFAFFRAPAEANRATALIVPGVAAGLVAVCALIVVLGSRRTGVMKAGWTLGLVLAVVLGLMLGMTAGRRSVMAANYPEAKVAYEQAFAGRADVSREERKAFFKERNSTDHDSAYLAQTLWVLTFASAVAFFALLVAKPTPGRPGVR